MTDKRGSFRAWTLLLAIFAFSLSLLGTFLVRSGVLTSVHAFASDPARGLFILIFLGIVTGGALTLYAFRAPRLSGERDQPFAVVSRDSLILANNLLLASAAAMVLLGTLYPLIVDAMGWGKISVGPPYFGTLFTALMVPLVVLVPFGPFSRWQRDDARSLLRAVRIAAIAAVLIAAAVWLVTQGIPLKAVAGVLGAVWIAGGTLAYVLRLARDPARRRALAYGEIAGMCLAHFGIAVFVLGVFLTEATSIEKDLRLQPGERTQVSGYEIRFEKIEHFEGPNFVADQGVFVVSKGDRDIAQLRPQKRLYTAGRQVMTEAAIEPGFTRDLYVALGEPLGDGGAWSVRIYHKPFIRWIWLGALFMMLGGFVAAADRRYRLVRAEDTLPEGAVAKA